MSDIHLNSVLGADSELGNFSSSTFQSMDSMPENSAIGRWQDSTRALEAASPGAPATQSPQPVAAARLVNAGPIHQNQIDSGGVIQPSPLYFTSITENLLLDALSARGSAGLVDLVTFGGIDVTLRTEQPVSLKYDQNAGMVNIVGGDRDAPFTEFAWRSLASLTEKLHIDQQALAQPGNEALHMELSSVKDSNNNDYIDRSEVSAAYLVSPQIVGEAVSAAYDRGAELFVLGESHPSPVAEELRMVLDTLVAKGERNIDFYIEASPPAMQLIGEALSDENLWTTTRIRREFDAAIAEPIIQLRNFAGDNPQIALNWLGVSALVNFDDGFGRFVPPGLSPSKTDSNDRDDHMSATIINNIEQNKQKNIDSVGVALIGISHASAEAILPPLKLRFDDGNLPFTVPEEKRVTAGFSYAEQEVDIDFSMPAVRQIEQVAADKYHGNFVFSIGFTDASTTAKDDLGNRGRFPHRPFDGYDLILNSSGK